MERSLQPLPEVELMYTQEASDYDDALINNPALSILGGMVFFVIFFSASIGYIFGGAIQSALMLAGGAGLFATASLEVHRIIKRKRVLADPRKIYHHRLGIAVELHNREIRKLNKCLGAYSRLTDENKSRVLTAYDRLKEHGRLLQEHAWLVEKNDTLQLPEAKDVTKSIEKLRDAEKTLTASTYAMRTLLEDSPEHKEAVAYLEEMYPTDQED